MQVLMSAIRKTESAKEDRAAGRQEGAGEECGEQREGADGGWRPQRRANWRAARSAALSDVATCAEERRRALRALRTDRLCHSASLTLCSVKII